jgi:hypothetical protein
MKERLVKGANLVGVVRLLRSQQHSRPLPEMGAWEQDLLRKRVSGSTWYALRIFDSLLQIAHRYVFDGSEAAAQNMGRYFAQELQRERVARGAERPPNDPLGTLSDISGRWRSYFNFGEFNVTPWPSPDSEHGARVHITGYPDMSACHGHTIIGWSIQLIEYAGAKDVELGIEERPWMHNSVLTYTLSWAEQEPAL